MKITVNFGMFAECFKVRGLDNFSYSGLKALYDHLEELEWDSGEELECDPIGFCCEFAEYANLAEAADDYGITTEELVIRTMVIEFDGGIIIKKF